VQIFSALTIFIQLTKRNGVKIMITKTFNIIIKTLAIFLAIFFLISGTVLAVNAMCDGYNKMDLNKFRDNHHSSNSNSAINHSKNKSNCAINYSNNNSNFAINHSNNDSNCTIVYGFWPDYLAEDLDPSSYQIDWNTLTHVAYSGWDVNEDGTLINPTNISNYNAVKSLAHQHGVKVIVGIYSRDQDVLDNILANHREDFANNVLHEVQTSGADGVNLDLEFPRVINSITHTSNTILFDKLMATLHKKLKTKNPAYHISFDVGWDINTSLYLASYQSPTLKQYIDSVFLMGYDYSVGITGPNSPYNDPTKYDVVDSVNDVSKYFNKTQIILGLPVYGFNYSTTSNHPGSSITSYRTIDMGTAISNSHIYGRIWDSNSHTPWYRYKSGNGWNQVWYDDDESLKLKYQYAKSENLGGVGFWALGLEGNHSNIWGVFR